MSRHREKLAVIGLLVAAVLIAFFAPVRHSSHSVFRVPASCTSAALLAEANQLRWERVLQAHADLETEALDGATFRQYRSELAGLPVQPKPVDLGACAS